MPVWVEGGPRWESLVLAGADSRLDAMTLCIPYSGPEDPWGKVVTELLLQLLVSGGHGLNEAPCGATGLAWVSWPGASQTEPVHLANEEENHQMLSEAVKRQCNGSAGRQEDIVVFLGEEELDVRNAGVGRRPSLEVVRRGSSAVQQQQHGWAGEAGFPAWCWIGVA